MIFRAIFWIGLVALLMPHEPDLGYGRPSLDAQSDLGGTSAVADWAQSKLRSADPQALCSANKDACSAGVSLLQDFRAATLKSLAEVKDDIRRHAKRDSASLGSGG